MLENKRFKKLLIPIAFCLSAFPFFANMKIFAENSNVKAESDKPIIMCYEAAVTDFKPDTKEDLKQKLDSLDKQYQNKRIDDKTYNTRKKDIQSRMDALNSGKSKDNDSE